MPVTTPNQASMFNDAYPIISVFRTDTELLPFYNEEGSGVMILPGEPFLMSWGAGQRAVLAQGRIEDGKVGHVRTKWTADFPCDFAADVVEGTPIYWSKDAGAVDADHPVGKAVINDVGLTNGFLIGYASWAEQAGVLPEVDGSGNVICADANSTTIRVVYDDVEATVKGTVAALEAKQAPNIQALRNEQNKAMKAQAEKEAKEAEREAKKVEQEAKKQDSKTQDRK